MSLCHFENSELAEHLQRHRGRVIFRGDKVKDDRGGFSVFTERLASASPAKVLATVSRLPRMAREANNPVSACAQVKMTAQASADGSPNNLNETSSTLECNLCCHPSAGLLWLRQLKEILLQEGWEKVPSWKRLYRHRHLPARLICLCRRQYDG